MNVRTPTIGFAGLSHLGLISTVAASEKGFSVVGYDSDREKIKALMRGITNTVEPNLQSLLDKNIKNIL